MGCSESGDEPPSNGGDEPLFAVTGAIVQPGGEFVPWLALFPEISADLEFDLEQAFSPGPGVFFIPGDGSILWMQQDAPVIERFRFGTDGELVSDGRVSFGAFGVASASDNLAIYISPTRAYLVDRRMPQIVAWNPETMEIAGDQALSRLVRTGLKTNIEFAEVIEDRLIVVGRYRRDADDSWAPLTVAAFVNPADDSIVYDEDERCGNVVTGAPASDGFVYLGSFMTAAAATYAQEGGDPAVTACQIRLNVSRASFDDDYFVDLSSLAPAGLIGGPVARSGNTDYYSLFDDSAAPLPPPAAPGVALTMSPAWQVHTATLGSEAETLAPVSIIPPSGTIFSVSTFRDVDGVERSVFGQFAPDFSSSQAFDLTSPEDIQPLFTTPGPMGQVTRVR
ncbi:MAG: hypothetical protein AAGF12_34075 [Myxococcota bacterium]